MLFRGFTGVRTLRIVRTTTTDNVEVAAQMVKLVDTPASGAGDLTVVEVRVFFWAPIQIHRSTISKSSQKPAKAGFCVSALLKSTQGYWPLASKLCSHSAGPTTVIALILREQSLLARGPHSHLNGTVCRNDKGPLEGPLWLAAMLLTRTDDAARWSRCDPGRSTRCRSARQPALRCA